MFFYFYYNTKSPGLHKLITKSDKINRGDVFAMAKVMGITAGRKNGNSEILLKQALMACEEAGAEVTMINLRDFNIQDCTGCTACTKAMSMGKYAGCVLDKKDDKK